MKAQILKIAGVKTEAEFYRKFPNEEAFMKKHGKELKKAQYGTYVAGLKEQTEQAPLAYNDLYQDTMTRVTGVSKQERARQEGLAALKAGKSSEGMGIADSLGQLATQIAPMIAGAKNGKKMKKAQYGAYTPTITPENAVIYDTPPSTKEETYGRALDNIYATHDNTMSLANQFGVMQDIPDVNPAAAVNLKKKYDWKTPLKKAAGELAPQLGSLIGNFQQLEQNKKDIKKANQWADVSQIASQAALSRPEQSKRRYARPEDNLVTGMNPLGKKDSLLAAQNGAEIQNTYNPGDLYSDLGYEPLNDSNPKQYVYGGQLHKAGFGDMLKSINVGKNAVDLNQFAGAAGSVAGALGSAIGNGTGRGGAGSSIGSAIGGALGNFIPIPGVGSLIGSTLGGLAGGLFDADDQNKLQEAQDRQTMAINQATIGKGASNLQQANKAFMENGGYMNPEYNPQVIAKFGDYSVDQLLAPPHDADMLRSGGHLAQVHYTPPTAEAMYTGRDLPYQMEDGGQMAMGGDLQVHRGEAETLSYNPFLPGGGETIMFRGPSHDNGGMPISYGENGVEVEGGEPAIKLQDGGSPDGNLVVYGNMVIPDYGVAELGDKNAKGKKFKHYIADLSKIEAKQGKLVEKTTALINNADANDQFDKLSLNTGQANLIGTTMKLKEIAEKKKTAAAVQNAILDTASEMGLESDALAKGKIKYAKANDPYAEFGAKLEKAQKGKTVKYDPEFENFINQAMQLEQDNSFQAGDYRGGGSNFGTNEDLLNTPEKAKEYYYKNYWSKVKDLPAGLRTRALQMAINTGDPYGELLVSGNEMSVDKRKEAVNEANKLGLTGLKKSEYIQSRRFNENKENIGKVVEQYKKDPQAFLGKLDSEQNRYYDSLVAANTKGGKAFGSIDPNTSREFYDDYMGMARNASQQYIPQPGVAKEAAISAMPINAPKSATGPIVEPGQPTQMVGGFDIRNFLPKGAVPDQQIVNPPFLPSYTNWNPEVGEYVGEDVIIPIKKDKADSVNTFVNTSQTPSVNPEVKKEKKKGEFPWDQIMTGVNSVLPFLRPSNQIPLDPSQLSGELYALSQNQEEPVFAQSYQPMLSQGINISLQDQLNEITSQARSAERLAQNNPSALAMIASQAAEAKNKVLGEQFRLNQGEAQRVAETNRQTMNEAQKMNIGLFDQQQQRAAQAKSNTKMQNIAALNSINDKILKQKSENRQLGIMENMYNYRFTPNGVAYNMNPLAQFNITGNGKTSDEVAPAGYEFEKVLKKKKEDTTVKRNGSIVKAIKGL